MAVCLSPLYLRSSPTPAVCLSPLYLLAHDSLGIVLDVSRGRSILPWWSSGNCNNPTSQNVYKPIPGYRKCTIASPMYCRWCKPPANQSRGQRSSSGGSISQNVFAALFGGLSITSSVNRLPDVHVEGAYLRVLDGSEFGYPQQDSGSQGLGARWVALLS